MEAAAEEPDVPARLTKDEVQEMAQRWVFFIHSSPYLASANK